MKKRSKFARTVRRWRMEVHLTQLEVGRALGHSEATGGQFVSNWERGISIPPPKDFRKLAELYGRKLRDFADLYHEYLYEEADRVWHEIMGPAHMKLKRKVS